MTVTASQKYGFPMATAGTDPAPLRSDWMAAWTSLENLSLATGSGPVANRPATPPTPFSWVDPGTKRLSVHPGAGGTWIEVPLVSDSVPILSSPVPPASFAGAYPTGVSIFTTAASDAGWPLASAALVLTVRNGSSATQTWTRLNVALPEVWSRTLASASNSAWQRVTAADYASRYDLGTQNIPSNAWTVATLGTQEWVEGDTIKQVTNGLQITRAGKYRVESMVQYSGPGATSRIHGPGDITSNGPGAFDRQTDVGAGNSASSSVFTVGITTVPVTWGIFVNSPGAVQAITNRRLFIQRVD